MTEAGAWWSEVLGGAVVLTAGKGAPSIADAFAGVAPGTPVTLVARGWPGRLRLRRALRTHRLSERIDYIPVPSAAAPLVVATADSQSLRFVLRDLVSVPPGTSAHALASTAMLGARLPGMHRVLRLLLPDRLVTGIAG